MSSSFQDWPGNKATHPDRNNHLAAWSTSTTLQSSLIAICLVLSVSISVCRTDRLEEEKSCTMMQFTSGLLDQFRSKSLLEVKLSHNCSDVQRQHFQLVSFICRTSIVFDRSQQCTLPLSNERNCTGRWEACEAKRPQYWKPKGGRRGYDTKNRVPVYNFKN